MLLLLPLLLLVKMMMAMMLAAWSSALEGWRGLGACMHGWMDGGMERERERGLEGDGWLAERSLPGSQERGREVLEMTD